MTTRNRHRQHATDNTQQKHARRNRQQTTDNTQQPKVRVAAEEMKRKMNKRGERESAAGIAAAAGLSPLTADRTDSPDLTETAATLPAAAEANSGAAVTGAASNALQRCAALRCAVQLRRNPSPYFAARRSSYHSSALPTLARVKPSCRRSSPPRSPRGRAAPRRHRQHWTRSRPTRQCRYSTICAAAAAAGAPNRTRRLETNDQTQTNATPRERPAGLPVQQSARRRRAVITARAHCRGRHARPQAVCFRAAGSNGRGRSSTCSPGRRPRGCTHRRHSLTTAQPIDQRCARTARLCSRLRADTM